MGRGFRSRPSKHLRAEGLRLIKTVERGSKISHDVDVEFQFKCRLRHLIANENKKEHYSRIESVFGNVQ
ncbi:hypothetical protein TNCV_3916891 [Trichonephila clavipes]|nr:hypothetical protein TNCV_3916891 [Trichonephila clavipes]